MSFYNFHQNNSFGYFVENDNVAYNVIVEADNANDANKRAEDIGIYFDGCSKGIDCQCCGDRWKRCWDGYEYEVPSIYGESVCDEDKYILYYKDGTKVVHVNK